MMDELTTNRMSWDLAALTKDFASLVADRKDVSIRVQNLEKQLDICLVTINAINERLKDVIIFMHRTEDSQLALSLRISALEQGEKNRVLEESAIKKTLESEATRIEKQRVTFINRMKILASVQSIVFVGMEIWHHMSK